MDEWISLNDNGGWSWFQDERAIIDPRSGLLLVSSIANGRGAGAEHRAGDVDIVAYDLTQRRVVARHVLAKINPDDHNSAALLVRPDGRFLAVYSNHGDDHLSRWRISARPGDASEWRPERTFDHYPGQHHVWTGVTYSNLLYLASENRIYNFTRTHGYDPNFIISSDGGESWNYGGHLLTDPARNPSQRPYVKYASNGVDRIDFITTEGHPNAYNNGIYSGYLRRGKLFKTDGTLVGAPGGADGKTAPRADAFTPLLVANSVFAGLKRTHAWPVDLVVDRAGVPHAMFSSRIDGNSDDHRFYYARWNGQRWNVIELARAGAGLYPAEQDYTGLGAIDPEDPGFVVISTPIDPATGATMEHYELFCGRSRDGGATWRWRALTQRSSADNLRPTIPAAGGGARAILWLRGSYRTYTDYNLAVVGILQDRVMD
ncbi:BNR-4 repeat-containing protein [Fontivita pretiosa]|uniref:BNR-4 repeat-containing protein n=1 Tax=Fontivita pretiosa TaxID=2989684 RepID=UPI003D183321